MAFEIVPVVEEKETAQALSGDEVAGGYPDRMVIPEIARPRRSSAKMAA